MKLATYSLDRILGLDIISSTVLVLMFILFLWIVYRIYRTSKVDSEHWGNLPLIENDIVDNATKKE